jgi:hypothetical protein
VAGEGGVVLVAVSRRCSRSPPSSVANLLLYQSQAADAANIAASNAIRSADETADQLRVFATDRDAPGGGVRSPSLSVRSPRHQPAEERLTRRAEELDESRDTAERRYESYEWAETVLQMAIVFTTIGIAARSMRLIWVAIAAGVLGLILTFDGFLTVLPL